MSTWRKIGLAILAIWLLVGGYFVVRHFLRTDEDRVRAVVNSLVSDLESDNVPFAIFDIRSKLSEKYRHRGENADFVIDKEMALAYVTGLKQNSELANFKVDIQEMTITVSGDAARVTVTGRITAERKDHPSDRVELMTQPGLNRAIIDLVKEDGDWLVAGSERVPYRLPEPK